MKKLPKRIMTLMLSLVMIFGCIPCFTNEVSANESYYHLKIDNVNANIEKGSLALSITENNSIEVSIKGIYKEDGSDQGTTDFTTFEPNNTYYVHYSFTGTHKPYIKYIKGSNALIGYDVETIEKKEGVNVVTNFSIPNKSHICQWKIHDDQIVTEYEGMITFTIDDWSTLSCAMEGTYPANASTKQTIKDFNNNDLYTVEDKGDVRTITLLQDVTATSKNFALNVINIDKNIVLDLNGHVLDRGLISDDTETQHDHGSIIEITGGKLTIKDSNPNEEHKGNILSNGLWHLDPSGETIIKGGIITGGTGTNKNGGGIFIDKEDEENSIGSLVLEAGTIAGNTSDYGGGVRIKNGSSFTMNGGAISYNKGTLYAAGVNCESNTFTMNDGEISYNTGEGNTSVGGIYAGAKTTINGGKIIANKSNGYAGGIFVGSKFLTISGNPVIKNNINTQKTDNISWPQNLTVPNAAIKIENLGDAEIYISFLSTKNGQATGTLTSGCNGKGLNEVFFYDGPDTFYMYYDNGELAVKAVPTNSYKINVVKPENGSVTPDILYAEQGSTITLTTTPKSGYTFDEYVVLEESGASIDVVDNKFIMPESSVLVSATFKEAPRPTSSGSKTYKAKDEKKTAEKVSGTGKKGSTRTITPIEGKKVASVTVTDKDGNKIDVTVNEDGTYSFKQPASDVNVEVTYKNREITLNIGSTEASVDGERENLDVCPLIRNDRTMLPIRFVAENLGAKVGWDEKNPNIVTISRGDTEIVIHLGSEKMLVNGNEVILDSVAFAKNDRTYLPVRAISEALNAIVEWNEEKPMEVKIYER